MKPNPSDRRLFWGTKPFLVGLLLLATLLGTFYGFAGAGMYGSPLVDARLGDLIHQLIIISAVPLALVMALFSWTDNSKFFGVMILLAATGSLVFGWFHDFRHFWLPIFGVVVWLPSLVLGLVMVRFGKESGM